MKENLCVAADYCKFLINWQNNIRWIILSTWLLMYSSEFFFLRTFFHFLCQYYDWHIGFSFAFCAFEQLAVYRRRRRYYLRVVFVDWRMCVCGALYKMVDPVCWYWVLIFAKLPIVFHFWMNTLERADYEFVLINGDPAWLMNYSFSFGYLFIVGCSHYRYIRWMVICNLFVECSVFHKPTGIRCIAQQKKTNWIACLNSVCGP